jgi:hypothetical protein
MAFTEKVLQFTFEGASGPVGSFTASGLRAVAQIQAYQGRLGQQAQVKIWGLSMAQMNAYSTRIPTAIGGAGNEGINQATLSIAAGDLGSQLSTVMEGLLYESYIDLTNAPESAFVATVAPLVQGVTPMAAQSSNGTQDAEQLIGSICSASGLTLNNPSGAHATLVNQSTYGSAVDQITKLAIAAKLNFKFENDNVWIWPQGGSPDDVTINIGPGTNPRMVGYPAYYENGIIVTSVFNQNLTAGRLVTVQGSVLTKANVLWQAVQAQHDLSTMIDKGPWFTTAMLATAGT